MKTHFCIFRLISRKFIFTKKLKLTNTCAILLLILVSSAILSWLTIPASYSLNPNHNRQEYHDFQTEKDSDFRWRIYYLFCLILIDYCYFCFAKLPNLEKYSMFIIIKLREFDFVFHFLGFFGRAKLLLYVLLCY